MRSLSGFQKAVLILSGVLLLVGAAAALYLFGVVPQELKRQERETQTTPKIAEGVSEVSPSDVEEEATPTPGVVGSEEYAQALDELEEPWFPRQAVAMPKGPEGGDYPNTPSPVYTAYPS